MQVGKRLQWEVSGGIVVMVVRNRNERSFLEVRGSCSLKEDSTIRGTSQRSVKDQGGTHPGRVLLLYECELDGRNDSRRSLIIR